MAKLHKFEGVWYWNVVKGGQLYFGTSTSFLDALEAIERQFPGNARSNAKNTASN